MSSDDQPRDEQGRWTSGGGSFADKGARLKAAIRSKSKPVDDAAARRAYGERLKARFEAKQAELASKPAPGAPGLKPEAHSALAATVAKDMRQVDGAFEMASAQPSPEAQSAVRKGVNGIIAERLGIHDRSEGKSGAHEIQIENGNFYDPDKGRIAVSRTTYENAATFLDRASKGEVKPNDFYASGMHTVVHETLHAHSPGSHPDAYRGHGEVIEEATTELLARKVMREHFGQDSKAPLGKHPDESRAYDRYIIAARESTQELLGVSPKEAIAKLEEASIRMRKDATPAKDANDVVIKLMNHLGANVNPWHPGNPGGNEADAMKVRQFVNRLVEAGRKGP